MVPVMISSEYCADIREFSTFIVVARTLLVSLMSRNWVMRIVFCSPLNTTAQV